MSVTTARVLPRDEWEKLSTTTVGGLWAQLPTAHAEVLVAERDGQIVGTMVLLQAVHAECLEARDVATGRALVRLMRARLQLRGLERIWGSSVSRVMNRLLRRKGEAIPGRHFLVRV